MRKSDRRQIEQRSNSGYALFGGTGWLFADLMLAIAMVFLVANTVGTAAPPPAPHHPPPKPTVTAKPEAALDLNYVNIPMTVDANGLLSGSPTAIAAVRRKILADQRLKSRRAGLVLLFGGDPRDSPGSYAQAQALDRAVWKILQGLGQQNFVFQVAVSRDFVNIDTPTTAFQLNIYLFKTS